MHILKFLTGFHFHGVCQDSMFQTLSHSMGISCTLPSLSQTFTLCHFDKIDALWIITGYYVLDYYSQTLLNLI